MNNRIAAIASVAGTVGATLTCNPGQEIPVCHFHGTADTQVGYGIAEGGVQDNSFGSNVVDWISFWNNNNGCGNIILEGAFPNVDGDEFEVEHVEYGGCDNNSRVVHYKVHGADHVWFFQPSEDIRYTPEIWKFFLGLSPDDLVPATVSETERKMVGIYPNPVSDVLRIEKMNAKIESIEVYNAIGQFVAQFSGIDQPINVGDLEPGIYQLTVATEDGLFSNSFVKE